MVEYNINKITLKNFYKNVKFGKYSIKERNNVMLTFAGLFGVGKTKATKIASFLSIHPNAKVSELNKNPDALKAVKEYGNLLKVEYTLRRRIYRLIKRKEIINCYRLLESPWLYHPEATYSY